MYIYHALINVLSAHMIHTQIWYSIHRPTKTIYIKYYMEKQQQQQPTHTYVAETGYWN